MTEVTDADIELVEAITEAWSDYQDLWFKSGRRKDACQRYWDAKELAARHREAAEAPLRAEVERLREAVAVSNTAMAEYYRYWTGGETRGSYDGKPEREGLWRAMYKTRAALEPKP